MLSDWSAGYRLLVDLLCRIHMSHLKIPAPYFCKHLVYKSFNKFIILKNGFRIWWTQYWLRIRDPRTRTNGKFETPDQTRTKRIKYIPDQLGPNGPWIPAQDHTGPVEICVWDDSSSDSSLKKIESYRSDIENRKWKLLIGQNEQSESPHGPGQLRVVPSWVPHSV